MAQLNSPDMLPKHTNKIQLGINIRMVSYNEGKNQITNECTFVVSIAYVLNMYCLLVFFYHYKRGSYPVGVRDRSQNTLQLLS